MDKAEYKIATEQIKKLIAQGEYAEASRIADTIDWSRVQSIMMLCTVSYLYKSNRRYEDAKKILHLAYERNSENRTILYSLCDLSIKLGEFVEAIEYYKEFVEIAPKDTGRYVLQYRMYQAQDVSLEERIEVLEQLKSEEYIEKWAYELAYLYHRIGFATKCVEECDELILWFGKGRYVYKAMELKMLHEPLRPAQQYIYDRRFEYLEQAKDMTRVLPRVDSGDSEMTQDGMVDVTDAPTVEIPYEYLEQELQSTSDEIQVKTLDVSNMYSTIDLQKKLAESIREILDKPHFESHKEKVTDTKDTFLNRNVDEVQEQTEEQLEEEPIIIEPITKKTAAKAEPTTVDLEHDMVVKDQIGNELNDILSSWEKPKNILDIAAGIEQAKKDILKAVENTNAKAVLLEEQEVPKENHHIFDEELLKIDTEYSTEDNTEDNTEHNAEPELVLEKKDTVFVKKAIPEVTEKFPEKTDDSVYGRANVNLKRYKSFIRAMDTEIQIMHVLDNAVMEANVGNICITGYDSNICFDLVKALLVDLKNQGIAGKGKSAKISAGNVNKKEPSELIEKAQGGILIIEQASRLKRQTVEKIIKILQEDISDILIFMTDTKMGMNYLLERNPGLKKIFNLRVDIKEYTGDELEEYAVKYALQNEYNIDDVGRLALRTKIDEILCNNAALTLEDAESFVNAAIESANRKSIKHFVDILLRKRYDKEDMIILREADFL